MIKAFEYLMHRETWRQTALRLQRENDVLLLRSRRAVADRDRLAALLAPVQFFHVCACCLLHNDRPLATRSVTCKTCGFKCSCEGCVAEAADA